MGNTAVNLFGGEVPQTKAEVVCDLVAQAKELVVSNDQELNGCKNFILTIKDMRKQIDEGYDPLIKSAHDNHKKAIAKKKEFTDPLDQAERFCRNKGDAYLTDKRNREEQERRQREEQARIEAQKRVAALNEQVMALTADVGDRTEQLAVLSARLEDVADTDEGAIIRSRIAIIESGLENDAAAAQQMQEQAELEIMTTAEPVEDTTPKGVTSAKNLVVEVTDMVALCKAIGEGKIPPGVVSESKTQLKNVYKAGIKVIPGVRVTEKQAMRVSR